MAKTMNCDAMRDIEKARDNYVIFDVRQAFDTIGRAEFATDAVKRDCSEEEARKKLAGKNGLVKKEAAARDMLVGLAVSDGKNPYTAAQDIVLSIIAAKSANTVPALYTKLETALSDIFAAYGYSIRADIVTARALAVVNAVSSNKATTRGSHIKKDKDGNKTQIIDSIGISDKSDKATENAARRAINAAIWGEMLKEHKKAESVPLARCVDGSYIWPVWMMGEDAREYVRRADYAFTEGRAAMALQATEAAIKTAIYCAEQAAEAAKKFSALDTLDRENTALYEAMQAAEAEAEKAAQAVKDAPQAAKKAAQAAEDARRNAKKAAQAVKDAQAAEASFKDAVTVYEKAQAEAAEAAEAAKKAAITAEAHPNNKDLAQAAADVLKIKEAAKDAEARAEKRARSAKDARNKYNIEALQAAQAEAEQAEQAAIKAAEDAKQAAQAAPQRLAEATEAAEQAKQAYKATGCNKEALKAADKAARAWKKAAEAAEAAKKAAQEIAQAARAVLKKEQTAQEIAQAAPQAEAEAKTA